MTIFLILAPYGVYTFLMMVTSATISVFVASAICLATDRDRRGPRPLGEDFGRRLGDPVRRASASPSCCSIRSSAALGVKLSVDIGIFVISLGSMLARRPFTLQYAIESVPAETAAMPGFLTANYIITGAWTVAALLMMAANIVLLYFPGLPVWLGLAVAFAARNSAIYFTKWYPEYRQIKYGAPAGALPEAQ